jgi:uncharacterized protein (TIGR02118 family)
MIKVSVMYPNQPGVRFDHDYYRTKHLPLIKSGMGAALKYYSIDKALMDGEGTPLGAYVAMCHLFCDSLDAYQASFGPHAKEIRADIQNFTDVTSIHQISEVVVENSAIGATTMQHPIPRARSSSSHQPSLASRATARQADPDLS